MAIKTALVKRTAKSLIKEENAFNKSFDNNKKILGNSMPSKSVRNKIAGYLTKLRTREAKGEKIFE
jgi:ribosomal protein S17E